MLKLGEVRDIAWLRLRLYNGVNETQTKPASLPVRWSSSAASHVSRHKPREARASLAVRGALDGPRNHSPTILVPIQTQHRYFIKIHQIAQFGFVRQRGSEVEGAVPADRLWSGSERRAREGEKGRCLKVGRQEGSPRSEKREALNQSGLASRASARAGTRGAG